MADYNSKRRAMPKNSARAYRERVLSQAANYREQAAQSLRISAAMLAKARELIEQTRETLRHTGPRAGEEHPAESVPGRAKSVSIPYSVATQPGDNLALNRQLQAEQHALLEKNRELRESIKMKLQRHRDALGGANKRKR
jgi:hypothetical protein